MKQKEPFDSEIYRRSTQAIAHGALTNSKRPESFVKGVYPTHLKRAQGCYVWDTNDNRYIDFIGGLGSNLLGYAHDEINAAIQARLQSGITLSLGTDIEIEAAEKIKEILPFAERVRFLKTGSEACSAAIRIARAKTKRSIVISEGYHGWHDEFVSLTPPAHGVSIWSPNIYPMDSLEYQIEMNGWGSIAAVIVEPIMTDISPQRIGWLRDLRKRCTKIGALLIFDEVITGLRFPQLSVSKEYGISPDLICMGKAIGGGLPLSVVAGRADIMDNDYFVSSTFAGETLSLAACIKMLHLIQNKYKIDFLWEKGLQFMFRFNEIWRDGLTLEGYPTRSVLKGDDKTKALFMQECCKAGILVGSSFFFIYPHIEVMDQVLSTFSDILRRIRSGSVQLAGEMPQKPYAAKVRQS